MFSFTDRGARLAKVIAGSLDKATIYGRGELKEGKLKKQVAAAFKGKTDAIIFISATGIAVRSIAPFIKDKASDPAVVVIDERGKFAISLLSGHLGGANDLTRYIARAIKAAAIVTTATDLAGLLSIEEVASRFNLAIEDTKKIKIVNAAIVAGKSVVIVDPDRVRRKKMEKVFNGKGFVFKAAVPKKIASPLVVVSYKAKTGLKKSLLAKCLLLRPRDFVVGIGCRRGVTINEVKQAYDSFLTRKNLSKTSVRNIATIDIKSDERGLTGFAKKSGLEINFISSRRLKNIKEPPSGTSAALKHLGVPSVSENAALISAKTRKLWAKKIKTKRVTLAIARAASRS